VQKSLGRGEQDNFPAKVLRTRSSESARVNVGGVEIGGPHFVVIAGPCAVEGVEQMEVAASSVRRAGAQLLRGGAYKPRTSPYSFQGMGESGIRILCEAGRKHRLPVIAEVMEIAQIPLMLEQVDILQVGARNMQNFSLLRALSRVRRPVLLKRGFCATVQEWFLAAEYLLDGGNEQVVLCERGIRTFEPEVRNTLDLSAVAYAKLHARLPVIVDPSHATGNRDLVIPMALAAAACGADGLLLEVHPAPDQALCDGAQALTPDRFQVLMDRLSPILAAVGRTLGGRPLSAPAVHPQ
jgi:3-deoxy-7-phosphoheptulonate synthase